MKAHCSNYMARVHTVNKARKDVKGTDIKKGDSYYWWKFRFGGKQCSKTYPKRWQLTQSDFLSELYQIEDEISEYTCESVDELKEFLEEKIQRIEEMRDECQEKIDNMPEQLQTSGSGETLQERIDNLESWIDELNAIDIDIDEDSIREEAFQDNEREDGELKDDYNERIDEIVRDAVQEKIDEYISEMQNTSSNL
jgi:gas vesicle protein